MMMTVEAQMRNTSKKLKPNRLAAKSSCSHPRAVQKIWSKKSTIHLGVQKQKS